jgi:branched-chain amino acid transport system permease protein
MSLTILAIVTGLAIGSVYGLIAIGYSVVYRATRVFNLAQGDLVMLGVMLSWYLLDELHWPEAAVFVAVLAGVTFVSLVEERLVVRPFLKRGGDSIGWFIATLAFSLIIETTITDLYGDQQPNPIPGIVSGSLRFGSVSISAQLALAVAALVVVTVAVELLYRYTWAGTAMRAVSEDRDLALLRGIDGRGMGRLAFLIGGLIAGLAGFVLGPIVSSDPSIGLNYGLQGFVAMAVGGFGSIRGAVVGAWILGVAEQLFDRFYTSNYEVLAAVGVLLVVLVCKPTGLLSSATGRTV